GTAELQALKNGDLDGLVMFSPTVDRGVVEGYAYYPPCCDISSTAKFGGRNQLLGANSDFLKDRQTAINFSKHISIPRKTTWTIATRRLKSRSNTPASARTSSMKR